MKRFFWFCSGADLSILRTWDCSTEHNTYAGIGATIFLTAVLASISGGYALWTVFQSYPSSISFGILWGILIFNLDRYIVMSIHKRRGHIPSDLVVDSCPQHVRAAQPLISR